MGDGFDNGLNDPSIAKHLVAKSRWIIQGFQDPGIEILPHTVPAPSTSDVPLSLQILASMRAKAWVGDVRSALTQGSIGLVKYNISQIFKFCAWCLDSSPRWPKDGPKMAPKKPQDGPKRSQDGPKRAQDGPKVVPR